jgi:thioredoxin 1
MSATQEITAQSFEATVEKTGIVFLDWWAPWCAPCRAFGPTYEKVAAKHPDVVFGKVNTEAEPVLSQQLQIRTIPTLMIFRDGVLLFEQAGALPEAALEDLLKQAREVDIEELKREDAKAAQG